MAAIILPVIFLAMTQRLPCKKKRIRQSFRSLPSLLFQIPKKSNEAAWLDRNTARKKRTGQTKLHEHRLRHHAVHPDIPRWVAYSLQRTKVFWLLPAHRSAKTRRADFCWHRCSFARLRCLSILVIKLILKTLAILSRTLFRDIFDQQNTLSILANYFFNLFLTLETRIGQRTKCLHFNFYEFRFERAIHDVPKFFFVILRANFFMACQKVSHLLTHRWLLTFCLLSADPFYICSQ